MKLMKKSMAAILALAMCLSLLPVNVFAAVISDGHEHNTDGYVCTPYEVPADELVCGEAVHTHGDECYMIPEGMWDCIFAEHDHSTDYDELTGESFCPADSHVCGGECTVYCGEAAHSHSEFCGYDDVTGAWFCGKEAHSHSFACYQAQRQLMCTQAEHEHSAACYATETVWDCQAPEEPTVADMDDEENEYDTPDADPADPADIEDGEDTQKVYYENGGTYPVSSAEELYDALYADGNFTITLTANIEINGFDFPLERDGRGDIDGLPVYDDKTAAADGQPVYGGEFWVNGNKTLNLNGHNVIRADSLYDGETPPDVANDTATNYNNMLYIPYRSTLTITGEGTIGPQAACNNIIFVDGGTLNINGGTLHAQKGRAIWVYDGKVTMSGGTITSNGQNGRWAGAVGMMHNAQMTITGGMISENGGSKGGAIYVDGTSTLELARGTVITGNIDAKGLYGTGTIQSSSEGGNINDAILSNSLVLSDYQWGKEIVVSGVMGEAVVGWTNGQNIGVGGSLTSNTTAATGTPLITGNKGGEGAIYVEGTLKLAGDPYKINYENSSLGTDTFTEPRNKELATPSRDDGAVFLGWYASKEAAEAAETAGQATGDALTGKQFMEIANSKSNDGAYLLQGDGSITVYAAWKQKTETKSYTVEYYLDGNLDEGKRHTVTVENIPITDTVLTVDSREVNTSNAFGADAEFSHIGGDVSNKTVPETVAVGGVIKVYYVTLKAQLSITKTDGVTGSVQVSEAFTYTITVENKGTAAAAGVVISDKPVLDNKAYVTVESVTLNDADKTDEFKTDNKGEVSVGTLAPGAKAELKITVTAIAVGEVKNKAIVDSEDPGDPSESPEITTKIDGKADVKAVKTVKSINGGEKANDAAVEEGDVIVYTITVTNNGNWSSGNVTITDKPENNGLKLVSVKNASEDSINVVTGPAVNEAENTASATITGLGTTQTFVMEVTAEVTADAKNYTELKNTAITGGDPDGGSTVTVPVAPDVHVTKEADEETVEVGDIITYTIKVWNEGKKDSGEVTVTDTLPAGLELVDAEGQGLKVGTDDEGKTTVTFVVDNVAANTTEAAAAKLTVKAKATEDALAADGKGTVTNKVKVTGDNIPTPPVDEEEVTVSGSAVLVGDKKVYAADDLENEITEAKPGDALTYVITVANTGSAAYQDDVVLKDELKGLDTEGGTYSIVVADAQGSESTIKTNANIDTTTNTISETVNGLAAGSKAVLTINVKVPTNAESKSIITNKADVAGEPEVQVTIKAPKVSITKEADQAAKVKVGDKIVYTITAKNEGNDEAVNVVISDTLGKGLTLAEGDGAIQVTGTDAEAMVEGKTVSLELDSLAAGGAVVVIIKTVVTKDAIDAESLEASKVSNSATVKGGNIPEKKTPEVETDVTAPRLHIKKTASAEFVKAGDTLTYTVKVWNDGTAAGTAKVTDELPEGVKFASAELEIGGALADVKAELAADGKEAVSVTIPDLPVGGEATLTIVVKVDADLEEDTQIKNTAVVVDDGDPDPEPKKDDVTTKVADPDVTVTKTAQEMEVKLGETIHYTITAANKGEVAAKDVVITDKLDTEYLELLSAKLDGKDVTDELRANGTVAVGSLAAKVNAVLTIEAKAIKVGTAKNQAKVKGGEIPETPSEETKTEVKGLKVTKSLNANHLVERSSIYPGGAITYTITVENTTAEKATNVVLTDVLDGLVRFTSYRIGTGATVRTAPDGGEYKLGDLEAGASVTLTISVYASGARVGDVIYNSAYAMCAEMNAKSWSNEVATEVVRRPSGGGGGTTPTPPTPPTPPTTPTTPSGGGSSTPTPPTTTPTETITDDDVPLATAPGLNSTDHFAYIIGYEDNTVRPTNNITRAEVATIFFRLMTDEFRSQNWSTTNSFPDVEEGKWYNNAVSTTVQAGLVKGYTDGTFKPTNNITRAEFAAIAARFLSDDAAAAAPFSDTAGHWAEQDIARAVQAGWIKGYPDGTFHPNAYITRAEVMTAVNRMLDRTPDKDHLLPDMIVWSDNPETAWYYEAVQEATNGHDYERDEMGIIEIWTALQAVRDWAALEAQWATANS